ncbi:unnamed protein product [Paramecium primaurelia]|uniref:J domain-containing protein n=1 Tax=Paramecium primaurelia TaxID=5886 RepID=A0A8S1KDY9_PARPR|nr:unnamed protein product [Paramecium primaurelia]
MDYYKILEINRDASASDVAKAYNKLSLKWHPKLSKLDHNTTYHHFCLISEAYEVLSDPIKRTFYDKYGEEKLKEGFFANGNLKGGYSFAGNPEEIFEKFFGTSNPFAQLIDTNGSENHGTLFSHAFGGQNFPGIPGPQDLEIQVECTLHELYNGCAKTVSYQRQILNKDGITTRQITETKEIKIDRGIETGQKIVYKELGNEAAGFKSSDLIFQIKETPHPTFKRKGNDLLYIAKVKLANAIAADPIQIVTLDNRKLQVPVDQIISPKYVKMIENEGMPIFQQDEVKDFGKPYTFGNLYIRFDIQFPEDLTESQKNRIKDILLEGQQQ